jgi:hypothetical protein
LFLSLASLTLFSLAPVSTLASLTRRVPASPPCIWLQV